MFRLRPNKKLCVLRVNVRKKIGRAGRDFFFFNISFMKNNTIITKYIWTLHIIHIKGLLSFLPTHGFF